MRHRKKGRKLGTDASHTKAIKRNLAAALLANDRIKTTMPRAKEIRGEVERVITWAKRGDIHSRRLAIAKIGDKEIVREVFEKVAQGMFEGRNGGYTRIMRLGNRKGDNARMVIMELVTEPVRSASTAAADAKRGSKAPKGRQAEKQASDELAAKFKFDDEDEATSSVDSKGDEEAEDTAEEAAASEEAADSEEESAGAEEVPAEEAFEAESEASEEDKPEEK